MALSSAGKNAITGFAALVVTALIVGGYFAAPILFPKHVKNAIVKTKATDIPPLKYDAASHAPLIPIPTFNQPSDAQGVEVRGWLMGWNATNPVCAAVGGTETSVGSLCDSLGLNVKLSVQNNCTLQGAGLLDFADDLYDKEKNGATNANPTKGCTFINWMADANASYFAGLDSSLKAKKYGDDYRVEVLYFTGTSFGEDKWILQKRFKSNPAGSLTAVVVRDGDWNLAVAKCQLNGWIPNHDLGTFDYDKVNFVNVDDYTLAGKAFSDQQKYTLRIVSKGKYTGRDTTIAPNGFSSWFPVDQTGIENAPASVGGLVMMTSTKEFNAQMGSGLIFVKHWADEHPEVVKNLIEAFARAGDQIKSHDEWLQFASQCSEVVFADKEKKAADWYKAFKGFPLSDKAGDEFVIGGSRVFNISDAAEYVGLAGGSDQYKFIYNTFGNIDHEAYPEIVSSFPVYEQAVDWSFMADVYSRLKAKGNAGVASKPDFTTAQKGGLVGDANFAIQFQTGSAVISPVSYATLNKVIGLVHNSSNTFLEIGGHTDNTGNAAANQSLSEARAASVKAYFVQQDAALGQAGRITVVGYGQTKPLNPNDTDSPAARTKNRRVEIKLMKARESAYSNTPTRVTASN